MFCPSFNVFKFMDSGVRVTSRNYYVRVITRKASDAAEYNRVVRFFHPRSSCTTHLMLVSERPPIYASCMTISGGRTEQHVINNNCRFSGTSLALRVIFSGETTEQHVIIGFGELAAVN